MHTVGRDRDVRQECVDIPRDHGHVRQQQRHVRHQHREVRPERVEPRRVVRHVLDELGQPRLVLGVEQQRVEVAQQRAAVWREGVDVIDDVEQVRLDVVEPG